MSSWLEWGVFSPLWELGELIKPQEGFPAELEKSLTLTPPPTSIWPMQALPDKKAEEWRR